jgi:membrane associated rhomboid family serine protease
LFFCTAIWLYLNFGAHNPFNNPVWRFMVPNITAIGHGAWWGLLTCVFVHVYWWHILLNMSSVPILGDFLEPHLGQARYVGFIVVAGVVGAAMELTLSGTTGQGFSGVLYGMYGYCLARRKDVPDFEDITTPLVNWGMLGFMGLCMVTTAVGWWHIANGAHLGGFLLGFFWGMVPSARAHTLGVAGLFCMALVVVYAYTYVPLEAVQRASAGSLQAQLALGESLVQTEDNRAEGIKWLEMAAGQGSFDAIQMLAWYLATDTNPAIRNGPEAVKWAKAAYQMKPTPGILDTVAAAYAEAGQWDQAVSTETQAIADAGGHKPDWQHRLDLYKQHQPYRE